MFFRTRAPKARA